jgi:L-ascorbate metabolism protein UlaG (beta-lactamase superfamily)
MTAFTWLGHATVVLELGSTRVLTDPFLGQSVGPRHRIGPLLSADAYADIDVVLISHLHHDHFDVPSLLLLGRSVAIVGPTAVSTVLAAHGFGNVRAVAAGDIVRVGDVEITAVPAVHPGSRLGSSIFAAPLGFVIRDGRHTVYFAGDTAPSQNLDAVTGVVDLALLPAGGTRRTSGQRGHLTPRQAAELAARIRPTLAVPIHWGTLQIPVIGNLRRTLETRAGDRFVEFTKQLAPAVRAVRARPGERLLL